MKTYPAVIFDLGGVVINLSIEKTIESFKRKIPGFTDYRFCGKRDQHEIFDRYETGVTDTAQFYKEFLAHYHTDLGFEEFQASWNEMILDLPIQRIEMIQKMRSEGIRVFLLSNINPLHAEAVDDVFDALEVGGRFRDLFEKAYYSYEMGLRKPDPQIFKTLLAENGLKPETTLFIDDSLQHVESAAKLGIQTIHLVKPQTIDKL